MKKLLFTLLALASLVLAPQALATGGDYSFDGGNAYEQSQVKQALNVSAFDWSLAGPVTVHIRPGLGSSWSAPGNVWLDSRLLDAGGFSWGVVQHEYAHQVDFALFNDTVRAQLLPQLGGLDWWDNAGKYQHSQRGCERFASTLAWSYWPSPSNSMAPTRVGDESSAMDPAAFRALLRQTLITLGVQGADQLPLQVTLPGAKTAPPAAPAKPKAHPKPKRRRAVRPRR